jgi:hypothetical protein
MQNEGIKGKPTVKKSFLILLILPFLFLGCGASSGSKNSANNGQIQCNPNVTGSFAIRSVPTDGSSPLILRDLELVNPSSCVNLEAVSLNECGDFLTTINPDSWTVDENLAYLNSNAARAEICFHRGGTLANMPSPVEFSSANQSALINVSVEWTPQKINDLSRWYKADSFKPAIENLLVGQTSIRWSDFSLSNQYAGMAASGREPLYKNSGGFPVVQICGSTAGCAGVSQSQHLRIGSSFAEFANTDLTLFYVVARKNANVNYLLVNQSNGNNTGTFLGWVSNTQFRMGLNGPSGANQVTATVPAYNGTPQFEIWSGRLGTVANVENPGLRIYLNHAEVAANAAVTTQQVTATTIPYVGTQRSEHSNAHFDVAEILVYKRALTARERCQVDRYLSQKYNLTLAVSCAVQ